MKLYGTIWDLAGFGKYFDVTFLIEYLLIGE
jgi:hypothetical protein